MGEHHFNPAALAKANGATMPPKGARPIEVLPLGEDYVSAGFQLTQAVDAEGNLCAVLAVVAGKRSALTGAQLVIVPLGELGKIPVEKLKALIDKALSPKTEDEEKPE